MGVSTPTVMPFNLNELLPALHNLGMLVDPFTTDEIEGVVKNMKTDKAPGPDGFNGMFLRKCWHIIKEDFIKLCNDFHSGQLPL